MRLYLILDLFSTCFRGKIDLNNPDFRAFHSLSHKYLNFRLFRSNNKFWGDLEMIQIVIDAFVINPFWIYGVLEILTLWFISKVSKTYNYSEIIKSWDT